MSGNTDKIHLYHINSAEGLRKWLALEYNINSKNFPRQLVVTSTCYFACLKELLEHQQSQTNLMLLELQDGDRVLTEYCLWFGPEGGLIFKKIELLPEL